MEILLIIAVVLTIAAVFHARDYITYRLHTDNEYVTERIVANKAAVLMHEHENKKRQDARLGDLPFQTAAGVSINNREMRKIEGTNEFRPHGVYDRDQFIEAIYVLTRRDLFDAHVSVPKDLHMLIANEVGDTRR